MTVEKQRRARIRKWDIARAVVDLAWGLLAIVWRPLRLTIIFFLVVKLVRLGFAHGGAPLSTYVDAALYMGAYAAGAAFLRLYRPASNFSR